MKKRLIIIFTALIIIAGGAGAWWYFSVKQPSAPKQIQSITERTVQTTTEGMATNKVSAPPPLRAARESGSAYLTQSGVFNLTNKQRKNNGLPALTMNGELKTAAAAKVKDMFANRYFEHLSPAGVGPGGLAKSAGYDYIMVGENLALGNYENDQAVLQAWMASPGHRANILGEDFSEIGVAVGQGIFNGVNTWIAVQEFGKPRSACPKVDQNLKTQITADEEKLKTAKDQTDQIKNSFDIAPKPTTQTEIDAYNAEVDRYNALVGQINRLIEQIQGEITVYNGQVQATNACIEN